MTTAAPKSPKTAKWILCELGETNVPNLESYSPFCLKVHRALKFAGLAYSSRHGRPDDVAAVNPAKQVPVLLVGDRAIFDSTAILAHVEATVPGSLTHGLDASTTAEALLWEDYADTAINGYLVLARWIDDANWAVVMPTYFAGAPWFVKKLIAPKIRATVRERLVARDVLRHGEEVAWSRFRAVLDQLEAVVAAKATPFFFGDAPTYADIALFAQLQSFRTALTVRQRAWVEERKELTAWLDRVDVATRSTHISSMPVASNWREAPVAAISSHSLPSFTSMTVP